MARRITIAALFVAAVGLLLALFRANGTPDDTHRPPPVRGRNNTVLVLVTGELGLSNVHLATAFALLQHHPHVDVHVASAPRLERHVAHVSSGALRKQPQARPITFHALRSRSFRQAIEDTGLVIEGALQPPGLAGLHMFCSRIAEILSPWTAEDHLAVYEEVSALIDELDPAVVSLDNVFLPAVEAVRDKNRLHAVVSPNTLFEFLVGLQPWGAMFWKYPALSSGFPYPLPWHLIPANIYMLVRSIYSIAVMPEIAKKRTFLKSKGLQNPIDVFGMYRPDVPWISGSLPEASLPFSVVPTNVTTVGPIVISIGTVEEQDPSMARWLEQAPTLLINLGSSFTYSEARARAMATALKTVLDQTEVQVLWKLMQAGEYAEDIRAPLREYMAQGRVKIEKWLTVDPPSVLESGHIAAFIHHGGGNCYHEAIANGIPQVVLPLWVDLFNFAALVEDLGIGMWASKPTTPDWDSEDLAESILKVLQDAKDGGPMKSKAAELAQTAQKTPGRDLAAMHIARLAASGHV